MKKLYLSILLATSGLLAIAQDSKPPTSDIIYAAPIKDVAIFPNPARDKITVQVPLPASGVSDMAIYDMLGRRLSTHRTTTSETTLNISQWHEGVYLLSVNTKDGMVTKRFVKAD